MGENNQSGGNKQKRKERILRAIKSRRIKQYFTGASFILFFIGGWFYPLIGFFIPACMIAGVGLATRKGRKWCDWMCPRGSFADAYLKLISSQKTIPYFLTILTCSYRHTFISYAHARLSGCAVMARSIRHRNVLYGASLHYYRYRRYSGPPYSPALLVLHLPYRISRQLGRKK